MRIKKGTVGWAVKAEPAVPFFRREGMKRLFSITDDLTGAADSGSYFTNRGIELTNYTELNPDKITLSSEHNICLFLIS